MKECFFYLGEKLSAVVSVRQASVVFQSLSEPLAEQRRGVLGAAVLLPVNSTNSIMHTTRVTAYTPYGYFDTTRHLSILGFNGQARDVMTGCDFLGKGKRAFNSGLMRFNSPDRQSPFGPGGINGYGYCSCDPINYTDPSGNMRRANNPNALTNVTANPPPPVRNSSGNNMPSTSGATRAGQTFQGASLVSTNPIEKPLDLTANAGERLYPDLSGYTKSEMRAALAARDATIGQRAANPLRGDAPVVDYKSPTAVGAIAVAMFGKDKPPSSIRTLSQYANHHMGEQGRDAAYVARVLKQEVKYATAFGNKFLRR